MSIFPGAIASFLGFTSSHTLSADQHASQHNSEQAEIVAAQTKIGTGSSTPTSGLLLRGTGAGTSSWAQANLTSDVTGVLSQANGGTGTTLATGTGKAVYDTSPTISGAQLTSSPTITTPTIADFTNSQHNHQNTAGGGQLAATAISSLDLTNTTLKNPYKFSVYITAVQNVGTGATVVLFDTKNYDTSSNVDIVTNKGRFTAPVAGFYHFNARVSTTSAGTGTGVEIFLYKNGSVAVQGDFASLGSGTSPSVSISEELQLSTNDFVDVRVATGTAAKAVDVSTPAVNNGFSGFLVSTT